ncbi:MAG: TlyA family RNA methyltransferase [Clostridia bacterium]|nr:TlyA family RNA methyltransferase [Clostridia bacterium]
MRIDKYLSEKLGSRTKAANAVEKGLVKVNGKAVARSYDVKDGDEIEVEQLEENFVSAGGFKLQKALKDFSFSTEGKIFADIGASTGGFCDCLLKNGAKKVYCIDVGESQLDKSLLNNNVVVIDNFNARNLHSGLFEEELDGVTIDVSFISLTYILGAVAEVLGEGKCALALIKPQFECESKSVGKNGIVRDKSMHAKIISKIYDFSLSVGLAPQKLTNAPIIKGKNLEYLILLKKGAKAEEKEKLIKTVVL